MQRVQQLMFMIKLRDGEVIDSHTKKFAFADLSLARRLERAEAQSNARFVEARAKLFPNSAQRENAISFFAELDGQPIATGVLC